MKLSRILVLALSLSAAWGQDKEKDVIVLKQGMFSRELGMLDAERDDYATYLAVQAVNYLAGGEGKAVQAKARRMVSLAKKLSARNKQAVAAEVLFGQEAKPAPVAGAFTPVALAQLLLTRGKMLVNEEGAENHWVGRAFVELAVELDPKNKQAVQESENQKFDLGEMDWGVLQRKN